MRRLIWLLEFVAVLFVTLPVAGLPRMIALKAGDLFGDLLHMLWRSRRSIAVGNLSGAVARGALQIDDRPEAVIRRNFRNLGRSFVEVLKIYYGLGDRMVREVEIRGAENITAGLSKGRGVLLITGHCGNWELCALAAGRLPARMNVVARPINNPLLNFLVERTRRRYGNNVIYKKGAIRNILSALQRNEMVGILMDQSVLEPEGVAAEFLGKKDYVMKTPALIAMKTGAAVIPAFIRRSGNGHVIEVGQEIALDTSEDVEQAAFNDTVLFSGFIENYIRKYPEEWLWLHRRWKRFQDEDGEV